ncbi:uncharacterized protein V1516DRAFT_618430 [Lipomyces oligophaga]|uniref:uncharacterized protein n=1 Tax=Lipomyces oligophaga TaxID=45792 RepID=UPI0034CFCCA6
MCQFCPPTAAHISKYECPRCNQHYCSLKCYKSRSHSACVLSFRRDVLTDNSMMLAKPSISNVDLREQKRLRELVHEYEILAEQDPYGEYKKYVNDISSADSDDELAESDNEVIRDQNRKDLQRRMNDIDFNSADFNTIWARLTITEQADFLRLVQEHSETNNDVFQSTT